MLDTGAGMTVVLADGKKVANPIGTCVAIREKNAGQLTDSRCGARPG